jgi:molecular chaperone GrpE (heat shock protein)
MHRIATTAAGFALALGSLTTAATTAHAAPPEKEPCARQAAQVAKAEEALAKVTAVFDKQRTKATKATKKAKKAQVQRLAKAQERLAKCEAAPVEG